MNFLKYLLIFSIGLGILACGMYEPVDQRGRPDTAKNEQEKYRRRQRSEYWKCFNRTGKLIMNLAHQIPLESVT